MLSLSTLLPILKGIQQWSWILTWVAARVMGKAARIESISGKLSLLGQGHSPLHLHHLQCRCGCREVAHSPCYLLKLDVEWSKKCKTPCISSTFAGSLLSGKDNRIYGWFLLETTQLGRVLVKQPVDVSGKPRKNYSYARSTDEFEKWPVEV